MQPLVSVCMPVWNGQLYVAEAIDSILRQTYGNFELIVQNDQSTDATAAILGRYSDPRLRVECNTRQLGQVGAVNRAIERASGHFLRFFSHDDRMLADDLETMVRCCVEHPEIGACFSTCFRGIDENGRVLATRAPISEQANAPVLIISIETMAQLVYKYGGLVGSLSSLMVARQALEHCGAFNPQLEVHVDWELCQRIATRYPIALLAEELCEIRVHAGQYTHRIDPAQGARETYALLDELAQHLPPDSVVWRDAYRCRAHSLRYFRSAVRALLRCHVGTARALFAEIARHDHLAVMLRVYALYVGRRLRQRLRQQSVPRFPYACDQL